jgi:hypothetical protein
MEQLMPEMPKRHAAINPKTGRYKALPTKSPAWTVDNMHLHPIKRMKLEGGPRWEKHLKHLREIKSGRPIGVTDGWGRQLDQLFEVRKLTRKKAEKQVQKMVKEGIIPKDDELANRAVTVLLELAEGPESAPVKAGAAKALLEFTKQKPVNKHEVKAVAEEWLASLEHEPENEEDTEVIER